MQVRRGRKPLCAARAARASPQSTPTTRATAMQMPPVDRSPNWRPPQGADVPPAGAARAPDAPDPAETGDRRAPGTTANTSAIGTTVQAPDKTVAPDLP